MVDLRQSEAYARFITTIGWKVVRIGKANIFIRPLWVFGAIAKMQRVTNSPPWEEMKPILKANGVWMFLTDHLATKTSRIDLTQTKQKIYGGFKKDARYCLQKVLREKRKVLRNDFEGFYEIWKKSSKRKNLWIPSQKNYLSLVNCFGKNCYCITIDNQAGCLVLIHDFTAYYYYAGATAEGTMLNLPYLVAWKAMQEAKKRGCKIWDWEGIYDERWPNKGWKGFTHFKKSFGGSEVCFPGSFTKWIWPSHITF